MCKEKKEIYINRVILKAFARMLLKKYPVNYYYMIDEKAKEDYKTIINDGVISDDIIILSREEEVVVSNYATRRDIDLEACF